MKRFFSVILAIILACAGTFDTVLASGAAASDELPEGTKSVTVAMTEPLPWLMRGDLQK